MPLQLLSISDQPSFEVSRPRSWESELERDSYKWSSSLALVCPRCLQVWARLQFAEDQVCHPAGAYCESCRPEPNDNSWSSIPGSIFSGWFIDLPLLAALPEPLLRREFDLHMKEQERWS